MVGGFRLFWFGPPSFDPPLSPKKAVLLSGERKRKKGRGHSGDEGGGRNKRMKRKQMAGTTGFKIVPIATL